MGTTTKMAIPYPEATGLVKDGWEDMKDIATQVDAKSGLVLIATASFSAVSSVSLANDTFTTNYDNYRILISLQNASSTETNLNLRLRAAGSDNTTANYGYYINRFGLNSVSYPQGSGTSATTMVVGTISSLNRSGFMFDIMSPKLSQTTSVLVSGQSPAAAAYSGGFSHVGTGLFATTTSFDSLTIYTSENITGTYSVFGYNK